MVDDRKITLIRRTRESCHAFYQALVQDPVLFGDGESYQPYQYDPDAVNALFHKREQQRDRMGFSVLLGNVVIGDVSFKHIDREKRCCELEICMTKERYCQVLKARP